MTLESPPGLSEYSPISLLDASVPHEGSPPDWDSFERIKLYTNAFVVDEEKGKVRVTLVAESLQQQNSPQPQRV